MVNRIRIGGLWVNTDNNGNKYLGGNFMGNARLTVIKNGFKQKDSEPDYVVYISDNTSQEPTETEEFIDD